MMENNERDNDIVTVSKVQISLKAGVTPIQSQLSELSVKADTQTPAGLFNLLQDSAELLLENSADWTHVLGNSQTFPSREQGEAQFEKLSLEERSKYSAETLSNVEGKITRTEVPPATEPGEAAYVVVTLLVGTADDRPLFSEIDTAAAAKEALNRLRGMRSDYLLVLELLWSPQAPTDTLGEAEMMRLYGEMSAIA